MTAWLVTAYHINFLQYSLIGEWQTARRFSDLGFAAEPLDVRILGRRVLLEYEVGDFNQGQLYLERLLESWSQAPVEPTTDYTTPALFIPLVARITGVADRLDVAQTIAQNVISSPTDSFILGESARAGLGLLAVLRGDTAAAEEHYYAIESRRVPIRNFGPQSRAGHR